MKDSGKIVRAISISVAITAVSLSSACGGGGGTPSSGGSNGGGGGKPSPTLSIVSPSSIMTGTLLSIVDVYGQNFRYGQVYIDGLPTTWLDTKSNSVEAQIPLSFSSVAGVHQVTVQNGDGTVSNPLPFTVYTPQNGPLVMQAMPAFLVGDHIVDPTFITTADLNGDGLSDVVMQGPVIGNSNSIATLYGQTDGNLSNPQYIPVPSSPTYSVAAGDISGDGSADLLILATPVGGTITLTVLLGDGHGNFQPGPTEPSLPTGYLPGPAYLTDVDGDGMPDLVFGYDVPGGLTGAVAWMKNTGNGDFAAPVVLASSAPDSGPFVVADFNQDGKPDVLYIAPTSPQSLHILMNSGGGSFVDQPTVGLNGVWGQPTIIDFNLDGVPDLVVDVGNGLAATLYTFAGKGNGSFTLVSTVSWPGPSQLVVGDFDHDGFPDLIGAKGGQPSGLIYFFGDGHGNFVQQQAVGAEGSRLAVGDFNGDGLPDVVVPDLYSFVALALGRTDRNFPSPFSLSPATATWITAGDVNGDGWPELLVGGDPTRSVSSTVFLNQKNNTFSLAAYLDPSATLSNLTGKGVADLVGGTNNNLIIWPNNGSLNFSASSIVLSQPMSNVGVADLDGDGHPDLISACLAFECTGQVFYGNGAYQFSPTTLSSFSWPYVVGDFNGDGKLDIATCCATFLNSGGRSFQEVPYTLGLGNGTLAAVGDFNGDGLDDVAVSGPGSQGFVIYYSKGDGTFYLATVIDTGDYPAALAVGDFNGDGRTDLAVGMIFSHEACVFLNTGQGLFTRSCFATGAQTDNMIATDLNRDGKPDLAITNVMYSFTPPNAVVVFHK